MRGRAPALIVTNHPFLTVGFTLAQRSADFPGVPVVHFATEPLDASALWSEPRAERVAVPSRAALRDLKRMGVAEDKLDLVGYPVQQPFLHAPSKGQARCALGLEDTFTCLVAFGSEGVSRGNSVERTVRALLEIGVQVVAVTGRNERLRERLETLAHTTPDARLSVRGFVNNMAEYLAACDLVVGKAGPASVMEALAVGRPVLVTRYAGLNEYKLVRFLTERNLGAYTPNVADLTREVTNYRASPERLCEVATRSAALGLAEMTEQIAHYLAHAATCGLADARLRGGGSSKADIPSLRCQRLSRALIDSAYVTSLSLSQLAAPPLAQRRYDLGRRPGHRGGARHALGGRQRRSQRQKHLRRRCGQGRLARHARRTGASGFYR